VPQGLIGKKEFEKLEKYLKIIPDFSICGQY